MKHTPKVLTVALISICSSVASATEYVPLFDAQGVAESGRAVNIANRWVFDETTETVYCSAAGTAYVVTDNEDGTYGNPIVDNYITAGNDLTSICAGGVDLPDPIGGTNCFNTAAADRPLDTALEDLYTSSATAPVALLAGENTVTFKLWDWGSSYGNTKLVLELPANCSTTPPPINVGIDLKPGSYPNSVNLCSNGVVTAAILGSADFDVYNIDLDTLKMGTASPRLIGKGNKTSCSYDDVSGDFSLTMEGMADGYTDLVCQYQTLDLGDVQGNTSVTFTGALIDESTFEGTDTINIVKDGCE